MADNELKIDLTGNAETRIDGLIQKLRQATAEASNLVSALDKGAASPADVRGAISTAAGAQSALSGLASSATSTPSGGQTSASQSAATSISQLAASAPKGSVAAAAASFPGAIQAQIAAQLGASASAPAATQNVNHVAAQVALSQSAMNSGQQSHAGAASSAYRPDWVFYGTGPDFGSGPWRPSQLYQGGMGGWPNAASQAAAQANGVFDPNKTQAINVPALNAQRLAWQQAQQQMAMRYAGFGAIALAGAFNQGTAATISGHIDPVGNAQVAGAGVGGMIGLRLAGLPGAAAGMMLGGAFGGYVAAPIQKGYEIFSALSPIAGLNSGGPYGPGMHDASIWSQNLARRINGVSSVEGRQNVSAQSLAAGYSTAAQALIAGGIDPFQQVGTQTGADMLPMLHPGIPDYQRGMAALTRPPGRGFKMIEGALGLYTGAIRDAAVFPENRRRRDINRISQQADGAPEDLGESISRRIHYNYPDEKAAQAVLGSIAPIYGSMPETGGNVADILLQFGAQRTYQAMQGLGRPRLGLQQLMETSADIRSAGRLAQFAGLQARGSGAATQDALQAQMAAIGSLPGGKDSLAYAETAAGFRHAGLTAFNQSQTSQFDTPLAALQGQLAVAKVMPYAPGQVFGLQAQGIKLTMARANRTQAFLNFRRQSGQLSEDEELSLTQQIASDRAASAGSIAEIAEGAGNILPGIAAGGRFGAAFHRFNSVQQASLFLGAYGSPRRSYGAMGGRQAHAQQDFYDSFGVPTDPYSRSAGANGGMGGGNSDNLLVQILRELQQLNGRGAGSFPRMDRNPRDIPPGGYGAGGKFN